MTPDELLALLQEFYRDKLELMLRHKAGAERVGDYDVNNTYQYVIAREEAQLTWLRAAIEDLGSTPVDVRDAPAPPQSGKGREADLAVLTDDSERAQAFMNRWRDRIERVTHARHQGMLRVILGETMEHKRFFDQAIAGRSDLLGRHPDGAETTGHVLPTRWIE